MKRVTVERGVIVRNANKMIAHLAESGTNTDKVKREAIIEATKTFLLEGNSYAGFRFLNPPSHVKIDGWTREVYDETRIEFY